MSCYVAHPAGLGPFPVVIVYMDVPGIRPELFAKAVRSEADVIVLVIDAHGFTDDDQPLLELLQRRHESRRRSSGFRVE